MTLSDDTEKQVDVPLVDRSVVSVYSPDIPSSPQVDMLPGVSMAAKEVMGKRKEKVREKNNIPSNKISLFLYILLINIFLIY